MDQDLACRPAGVETLLVGDLNIQFVQPWYRREDDLATDIVNYKLVDQTLQLISRRRYRWKGGWSWSIWRDGRPITSREEYILGMEHRDFYNVCIREPRVLTDHRMIRD